MSSRVFTDLRYAARTLLNKPGFAFAAVLTLALGIGANESIFRVIDALLLRPLPYPESDRLVQVYDAMPRIGEGDAGSTVPDYLDQQHASTLADVAIYKPASFNLSLNGAPQRMRALLTTPSLFSTLAVKPLLGRSFNDDEITPGQDKVAVLSYDVWRTHFAADPAVVGSVMHLDGVDYRVIGVMPPDFFFPDRNVQLWVPYAITPQQRTEWGRDHSDVDSIARMQPGVTIQQVEAEFAVQMQRNAEGSAELRSDYEHTGFTIHAKSLHEEWFGAMRPVLLLLQTVVAMLLLITCANVANLMLVRFSARQKEFALRSALGAASGHLLRQILVETLLLAVLGAALGLAFSQFTGPLMRWFGLGATLSRQGIDLGLDLKTLALAASIAAAVAILLSLLVRVVLRRTRSFELLTSASRATSGGRHAQGTRNFLIVMQLALTIMLLIAAGLLLKSFQQLSHTHPGFSTDVLTARVDLPQSRYADPVISVRYYERLLEAERALPGVQSATYTSSLPFSGHLGTSGYVVEGYAGVDAQSLEAQRQGIDEGYFSTMAIPLIEGRAFQATDTAQSTPVVIIDELLAKRFWSGGSALGHRLRLGDDSPWLTIVGVVPSVHHLRLADQPSQEALYWPYRQHPAGFGYVVVKPRQALASLAPELRKAALQVDPELPLYDVQTLDERISASLDQRRAPMSLLAIFAALALVLAAVGIYGVLAFSMAQRTGELGVRMAIGARSHDILKLALVSGARLIVTGIGVGLIGAMLLGRFMRAQLFGISPIDPTIYLSVIATLGTVAMLACWLPARRAAKVSPIVALRFE